MTGPRYDAFLSHHGPDKPAVEALGKRLEAEGIRCWLDKWNLIPGDPWQPAMVEALRDCRCCVVFFGPSRGGPWQNEGLQAAIAQCVEQPETYRVLPVLLPGARRPDRSSLPTFLQTRMWIEFADRLDDEDAFHQLVCGVRGIPPGIGPQAATISDEVPYRGLEPFLEQHARYFFGREAQVQVLLDKLRDGLQKPDAMRFLAIVGASGSGKSSLAQAGLIPALRRGSPQWPVVVLRPGRRPLESLAVALAGEPQLGTVVRHPLALRDQLAQHPWRLHMTILKALRGTADSQRAVLVVDQFEETFTLCPDEEAAGRAAFIDSLLHAATVYGGRTVVVLTMRADFYGHCAAHARLAAAVSDHQDLVPPLDEAQLREAIERPAALCDAEFEPDLVDALVHDMRGQTGALPLLQHMLHELWEYRTGPNLTLETYRRIGTLDDTIARRAERLFEEFTDSGRRILRRVLARLVQIGEGSKIGGRQAKLNDLGPEAIEIIQRLAEARLVMLSADAQSGVVTIEVTHEAIIRTWPRLRAWLREDVEFLRWRERLAVLIAFWEENRRDDGSLLRGVALSIALSWLRERSSDFSQTERAFVSASRDAQEREARASLTFSGLLESLGMRDLQGGLMRAKEQYGSLVSEYSDLTQRIAELRKEIAATQAEVEASTPLVFISYAREDQRKAFDLYDVLRDKGVRPWIDEKDLLGGEDWERTITATLKRADFIVICFSSTVVTKKGFVQREIRIALEAAKENPPDAVLTIPVRFDECTIPTEVAKLHCVDVFQPDGVERLIRAIVVHWGRSKKRLNLLGST